MSPPEFLSLFMIYFSSQSLLFYFKPLFCGDSLRLISGRSSLQLAFTVTIRPQGHELKDLEITNPHPAQRGPAVLQSPYWKSRSGTTLDPLPGRKEQGAPLL